MNDKLHVLITKHGNTMFQIQRCRIILTFFSIGFRDIVNKNGFVLFLFSLIALCW